MNPLFGQTPIDFGRFVKQTDHQREVQKELAKWNAYYTPVYPVQQQQPQMMPVAEHHELMRQQTKDQLLVILGLSLVLIAVAWYRKRRSEWG